MNNGRKILVAIVLILSYFCFLLLLEPREEFVCRGESCPKAVIDDLNDERANLNQSVYIEIHDIEMGKSINNIKQNGKQIIIGSSDNNSIIIKIPYRYSPGSFNYVIPNGINVEDIGIHIFHSKTFNIILNKKIAYTHYYPVTEFEFNHSQPLYVEPQVVYKEVKIENDIFIRNGSNFVFTILAIVTGLTFMCFWQLISRKSIKRKVP